MSDTLLTPDAHTRLVINPITRVISPKYRRQKAVYVAKGDHNSVLIAFEVPRYVDGHDMSVEENSIQIHYANINGEDTTKHSKGFSGAEMKTVERDDATGEEVVSFCWRIPGTATKYAGIVSIGITFERYDMVDGKMQEIYSWSTAPYGETIVWDSMDNSAEAIESSYSYLVETCNALVKTMLREAIDSGILSTTHSWDGTVLTITSAAGTSSADLKGDKGDSIKGDKGETAYELALENGFKGTEEEWLESLNGVSATHHWNGTKLTITSASGTSSADLKGSKGDKGDEGYTPQKGVDYWTESDKSEIRAEIGITNETGDSETMAMSQKASCNSFANVLKGTVSGNEFVTLKDVSPIEHDMSVKVSGVDDVSTVEIKKYGKNLLNRDAAVVSHGTLTFDGCRQTFTSDSGGGDLIYYIGDYKDFVGKTITVSYNFVECQGKYSSFNTFIQADDVELTKYAKYDSTTKQFKLTYTIPENDTAEKLRVRQYVGYMFEKAGDYVIIENLQVGIGSSVNEWENGKEVVVYTPNTDGTIGGVKSIYPVTTLLANTQGVTITATYNRDINAVIKQLEEKITALSAVTI